MTYFWKQVYELPSIVRAQDHLVPCVRSNPLKEEDIAGIVGQLSRANLVTLACHSEDLTLV